jgi:hypothetical protein
MNAETSKPGKTIWAFDLGKGSIGDPPRRCDCAANKKGAAKAPVQELRLMASLLSSRQFEILTTAGFDLVIRNNRFKSFVNYGLHT